MRRRYRFFVFFICTFLINNKSLGYVAADEGTTPVYTVLFRLVRSKEPTISEEKKREVTSRLKSYFQWPSSPLSAINIPVQTAEGVGEVFVSGDDISAGGITDVEGTVPIAGGVTFSGPVRASGTVTIAGRCGPARFSPLSIPPPYLPLQPLPPPIAPSPAEVPVAELPAPSYPPTITLPPVIIPTIVLPAYFLPKVVLPAEVVEIGPGFGEILITGDDIIVSGNTVVDGAVPALGDVIFEGKLPAGSVTICGKSI